MLELGCGTGDMWKGRETLISACSRLILSDFSDGMVATTKETVGNYDNIEYRERKLSVIRRVQLKGDS